MVGVHRGNKQGRDRGDPERKTRSKMPPGGHLRPLGGGFLITVAAHKCGLHLDFMMFLFQLSIFASAHKCGLHPAIPAAPNKITALCLSAQMRIASAEKAKQQLGVTTLPQRTNADCI